MHSPFSKFFVASPANSARWRRQQALRWLLCCAFGAIFTSTAPAASNANRIDYQLKAAFLYNFAKFIEWPPPPLPGAAPFRIGVLGDEGAHAIIAEALQGRMIADHPIEVVLIGATNDASTCRILFVPRTASLSPDALRALRSKTVVLLVGEKDGFAESGGEIGFIPRGDNLRYQVNLAAAHQVGFKLSARLASLAEIVHTSVP
jgi:hypothetical protein